MKLSPLSRPAACVCVVVLLSAPRQFAAGNAEILWDHYGIPHIFATDRESMFHAHGWAQMQNQANLLLRLYGESRGRAAEYWGPANLELDRWVRLNGVPERAHLDDQLPFMVQKKLLPVLRDKQEIEASLERRDTF
jgi:acyl-homoserine lactone acylase PvdQ